MSRPTIQDALADAVRSVAIERGAGEAARPLALGWLVLSMIAIALAALAFAALSAVVAVLVLYAHLGRDGLSDFMTDTRFDPALKARLSAFAVSAIYVGVALATLAAARLRGGRDLWAPLLALGIGRWRMRGTIAVALATLVYAIGFTTSEIVGRERHLPIAGPTDVVLLATLVTNLVILAPLAEELVFRGWLYTGLRARFAVLPSFLVTAAAFAAIHWDPNHRHMLRVLPLAVGVGLLRETTGGIRPTIALHAAYNGVIVAITLAST